MDSLDQVKRRWAHKLGLFLKPTELSDNRGEHQRRRTAFASLTPWARCRFHVSGWNSNKTV